MPRFSIKAAAYVKLLDRATTDDEKPTPGYLYAEIVKLTFESAKVSGELQDYLLARLEKPSADVKLKALRVMKHLLLKGHRTFRLDMQRRVEPLQACIDFRGPQDEYRGDEPNRLVREEAQELMGILFVDDARDDPGKSESGTSRRGEVTAIESSSYSSSSSYGSSSGNASPLGTGKYMPGTGNYIPPKPKPSGLLGRLKDRSLQLVESLREREDEEEFDPSRHWSQASSQTSNFGALPGNEGTAHESYFEVGERKTVKGRPGGVWSTETDDTEEQSDGFSFIDDASLENESVGGDPAMSSSGGGVDDLVKKVTTLVKGAERTVPTRMELASFLSQAKGEDVFSLAGALYERLADTQNWRVRLRCLYVLENLITKQDISGFGEELWDSSALVPLLDSPQTSVRDKASAVLSLMGWSAADDVEEVTVASEAVTSSLFSGLSLTTAVTQEANSSTHTATHTETRRERVETKSEEEEEEDMGNYEPPPIPGQVLEESSPPEHDSVTESPLVAFAATLSHSGRQDIAPAVQQRQTDPLGDIFAMPLQPNVQPTPLNPQRPPMAMGMPPQQRPQQPQAFDFI